MVQTGILKKKKGCWALIHYDSPAAPTNLLCPWKKKRTVIAKSHSRRHFLAWKQKWNQERREKSLAQWSIWASLTWKIFLVFWNPKQMLPSDVCRINYFWEIAETQPDERTHLAIVFSSEYLWLMNVIEIGGNPLSWTSKLFSKDAANWHPDQVLPRCYWLRPLDIVYSSLLN